MSNSSPPPSETSEALDCFVLPRTIQREIQDCATSPEKQPVGDVFYLWLQLDTKGELPGVRVEQWLNVVDEAASIGVNWLVVSMSGTDAPGEHIDALCRWAQDTHAMTVCLHCTADTLHPAVESLACSLKSEKAYLLIDTAQADDLERLRKQGVRVGMANPEPHNDQAVCDYPYKMAFVDAKGNLYTCGLVAGEQEFFLGSVFQGSLEQITHSPKLPHSIQALQGRSKDGCSGCPPLVARYLCPGHHDATG